MTIRELQQRLKSSKNNYNRDTQPLVKELESLLGENEEIIDAAKGSYFHSLAILVPTDHRILLIYGDEGIVRSEVMLYERITNVQTDVSSLKEDLVITMDDRDFALKDLSNTDNHGVYYYILKRIKDSKLPVTFNSDNHEICEPESMGEKKFGFLELILASTPITSCLLFWIMGRRESSPKYYYWTSLGYGTLMLLLLANGSIGAVLILWIISLTHFGYENEEYILGLNKKIGDGEPEALKQIEDVVTIDLVPDDIVVAPEKNIPKVNPYIEKMRQLNIAIEDETITNHLNEMEAICQDIFEYVEKHPEKETEMKNFINYYLPQTFSLLEKYDDLSEKTMKTANIQQAMDEITDVLAVIVEAFTNLYNKLYENEATQISTEIKVLKNILTQHGLTKDSDQFNLKK